MINCQEICFEIDELKVSITSPDANALLLEESFSMVNNISYKLSKINKKSLLVFDDTKRCPIIFYENRNYIIKLEFENPFVITLASCFELIDNINNTKYILKFNSSNYVGILNLSFIKVHLNLIEIESLKINYQEEYNNLLLKIAELDVDLTTRAKSIFEASTKLSNELINNDNLLATKFAYLKSKILSGEFENLYRAFLRKPISRIKLLEEENFSWEVDDLDINNYIDGLFKERTMVSGNEIPLKVRSHYHEDEIDTIENQFLKYVLQFIIQLLEDYKGKIKALNFPILEFEIEECLSRCYNIISNPIFSLISRLRYFPTKSNSLQVKYPYRDIFYIYMMIFYEVEINDEKVSSSMSVPLKDLPELYEYWCFLSFVEILNREYGNSDLEINKFIKYNKSNLCYTIVPSRNSGMTYKIDENKRIILYYNKSYSVNNIIYKGRSYSHNLDPDISLELFIRDKLVSIIHFDAKYKLENLDTFKNEDIDKMHTYKDAILGTVGAYVLYPGNVTESYIQEERDQVQDTDYFPSVGAFVLNVDNSKVTAEQKAILNLIKSFVKIDDDLFSKGIFTETEKKYNYLKRLID